jgi:hypothetical protein
MYNMNNKGPKIDPCGTPHFAVHTVISRSITDRLPDIAALY